MRAIKQLLSLPLLLSVGLHGLVIAAVTWGWESNTHEPRIYRPDRVQATLVEMQASPAPQEEEEGPNVVDLTEQRREQEEAEAERRRQEQAERQQREREARERAERERAEAERREREERERAERERREREERERQQREERERQERQRALEEAMDREQAEQEAAERQELTMSYRDQVARRIEQNWSRPPSARRGMECVLEINLVPTGEVVNVRVVQGSGNAAFDRSAEQAVRRVGRFRELQELPTDVFNQNFRQLRLVFRPEDLRL